MRLDKFTMKSQQLLQSAHVTAEKNGNRAIEPIHLLSAMLDDDQGIVVSIIRKIGVPGDVTGKAVRAALERLVKVSGSGSVYLSQDGKKVLDQAMAEAGKMKDQYVSCEHLLLGLVKTGGEASRILKQNGVLLFEDDLKGLVI